MSHSHENLTDVDFKFLKNLNNYTLLKLKDISKIKIIQRSVPRMKRNCTNRCALLHKFWERSQSFCNKVQRFVQFRCIFRAFQALKRTKNATKLHKSLYFVT